MRELLRLRDFRLLLGAQTLSMFGDWSLLLVFGIWVKTLTGSNALAGLVVFAMALPTLLAPLGGMVVDRAPRRVLVSAISTASAGVVLLLWLVRGPGDVWLLFVVAMWCGLTSMVLNAAVTALIQDSLPASAHGRTNAVIATVRQGLRLVAPLAGAGLFTAAGGAWVATLDAITFLIAAALVLAMRPVARRRPVDQEPFVAALTAGVRHIRAVPVLRSFLPVPAITVAGFGLIDAVVFALVDGLGRSPAFISVLVSAQGAAAVAAGAVVTALGDRVRPLALGVVGTALSAVALALETIPALPAAFAGFVVLGAALPMLTIAPVSIVQQHTPAVLTGRVAIAFEVAASVPYTVMIAVGALLVAVLPYQWLIGASALTCAGASGFAVAALRRERFDSPALVRP